MLQSAIHDVAPELFDDRGGAVRFEHASVIDSVSIGSRWGDQHLGRAWASFAHVVDIVGCELERGRPAET